MSLDLSGKKILDACCGGRMFWFDKNNPSVLFVDIRKEHHVLSDGRKFNVEPDVIMDFRDLKLPDNHFDLVVFDPPHMAKLGASSWMRKKYGGLDRDTWRDDIRRGFDECMRVLRVGGTMIFKWSEAEIATKEVIEAVGAQPLFGHTTKVRNGVAGSVWMAFLKGAR